MSRDNSLWKLADEYLLNPELTEVQKNAIVRCSYLNNRLSEKEYEIQSFNLSLLTERNIYLQKLNNVQDIINIMLYDFNLFITIRVSDECELTDPVLLEISNILDNFHQRNNTTP